MRGESNYVSVVTENVSQTQPCQVPLECQGESKLGQVPSVCVTKKESNTQPGQVPTVCATEKEGNTQPDQVVSVCATESVGDTQLEEVHSVCVFCFVRPSASRHSCLPGLLTCTCQVSAMSVVLLVLLLLAGSQAAPSFGVPGHPQSSGGYPSSSRNPSNDRYPSSDRYPSNDRYPSSDRYPSNDRYPSSDRYPSNDRYPSSHRYPSSNDDMGLSQSLLEINNYLPDNFTIVGRCLITILAHLCNGTYYTADVNIDHGPRTFLSSTEDYTREEFSCKGINCRIDKLSAYCNKSIPAMSMDTWATHSYPQQEKDTALDFHNTIPACQRHKMDLEKLSMEGGRSCRKKIECLCGDCCFTRSKDEVLKVMLGRTYNQLVDRTTKLGRQRGKFRRVQAVHLSQLPRNYPIALNPRCMYYPC
ncbi:hypothetical protein OTU49_005934 [Cherax quadricarinatus]|uniref:Uncharacterized protein n=1 Tax=Cherax quadricarinatus TaxID=27406 RepID=A0AAW0X4T2_CHEQU